jgi:hypothetical protein
MPASKPDHLALPLPVGDRRPSVIRANDVGSGLAACQLAAESRPTFWNAVIPGNGFDPSGVSAEDKCTNDTPSARRTTLSSYSRSMTAS